jgi:hypothetical protein
MEADREAGLAGLSVASVGDFVALLKPRVMSLVVFTALTGMVMAPGHIHPVIGFCALLAIAVGAGASGALNMWYEADIDALMSRTRRRPIPAGRVTREEALTFGLVNRVAPLESYMEEAVKLASKIAAMPRIAVRLIKDAVNKAEELPLSAGLDYEKRNFYLAFSTEDKTEGMTAFIEKRPPQWKHR